MTLPLSVADLALALEARPRGPMQWTACCPAHDDHHPSLSLAQGEGGKALVHCHAGCTQDAVLDALRRRGLWSEAADHGFAATKPAKAAKANGHARKGAPSNKKWREPAPIYPVPDGAPPLDFMHWQHGKPSRTWRYEDGAGRLMFYVGRWDFTDEHGCPDKRYLPLTYCDLGNGKRGWEAKAILAPRPLYQLGELLKRPGEPVLVCEGEKSADAAATLFPGSVVVSWAGGAKAVAQADWTPLRGRAVVVWGDNDTPGWQAAREVARHVINAGALSVGVVTVPDHFPKAWDLADDLPPGVTLDDIGAMISNAPTWPQPTAETRAPDEPSEHEDEPTEKQGIKPTPFVRRDPKDLPPRRWLYARHYIREFITATVAPGGAGKSSLVIAEALAMATGRDLLGHKPVEPLRVWLWNGEDPRDEIERRVAAACIQHDIEPGAEGDRLFIDSGRDTEIVIAHTTREGVTIAEPVVEQVIEGIKANKIDVMIVDPFVECHEVEENSNGAINRVARQWARIAAETGCSIELVHHVRKGGTNGEFTVEDARGATALIAAVRSARVLNRMTKDEAEKAGVDDHRLFFRVDNGKSNLAPPPEHTAWHRIVSVDLANGDNVGAVTTWSWPDPFEDVRPEHQREIFQRIYTGEWREDVRAANWAGIPIAEVLGLRIDDPGGKAQVSAILKTWLRLGILRADTREDKHRKKRTYVVVGKWPEDAQQGAAGT